MTTCAARYAGINLTRNIILVMALSGGLAGLAGMSEVAGVVHRLQERFSPGYGFTAIIIAWLAKLNPLGIVLVSYRSAAFWSAATPSSPRASPNFYRCHSLRRSGRRNDAALPGAHRARRLGGGAGNRHR